jgi:hypothetical protein
MSEYSASTSTSNTDPLKCIPCVVGYLRLEALG